MNYISVGRRFGAILIDIIVLFPVFLLVGVLTGHNTSTGGGVNVQYNNGGVAIPTLVWLAYFVILEATVGATVGKLAVGIRVVKSDGSKCDFIAALIRNVLRIVDSFPWLIPYLLGAILIWNSPTRQRLGDKAANTIVVDKASVGQSPMAGVPQMPPQMPPAPGTPPPPPAQPPAAPQS